MLKIVTDVEGDWINQQTTQENESDEDNYEVERILDHKVQGLLFSQMERILQQWKLMGKGNKLQQPDTYTQILEAETRWQEESKNETKKSLKSQNNQDLNTSSCKGLAQVWKGAMWRCQACQDLQTDW